MIDLGENFSGIIYLAGKAFRHGTGKYRMLVMRNLWRYLNSIVVMMHWVLSLAVQMVISISSTCYLVAEVFKMEISTS